MKTLVSTGSLGKMCPEKLADIRGFASLRCISDSCDYFFVARSLIPQPLENILQIIDKRAHHSHVH